MTSVNKDYPGLAIYDNFDVAMNFGASVIVKVDSTQYWRDRPLFLGYKEPVFTDAIKYNDDPTQFVESEEIIDYLDRIKTIQDEYDKYLISGTGIVDTIKEFSYTEEGEDLDLDIPTPDPIVKTIEIKDADGNIVETIQTDETTRDVKVTDTGTLPITILDQLPSDYNDEENPLGYDSNTITSLPDSYVRDKLWIAKTEGPNAFIELEEANEDYLGSINDVVEVTPQPENLDTAETYVETLSEPIDMWYGIPLINLSTEETPLEEAFILHIDTRKDWTLGLTNIVGSGLELSELRIDKTIPPDTRFLAGIWATPADVTIYLKIEGDETMYTASMNLYNQETFTLETFGADSFGTKTMCGIVYDTTYWTTPISDTPSQPLPYIPPGGNTYDGNPDYIRGNWIYPVNNWSRPSYNGGSWFDLDDDLKFFYNAYFDKLFCRYNLQNTDFSIIWYQYQLGYPTGIRTLISDTIHNNHIRYDYDNYQLLIDFNNVHYKEYVMFPEFLWTQVSILFLLESNELTISFRDFFSDRYEEISLDIGPDLEFELMSLWGRFDRVSNSYQEIQKGIFGLPIFNFSRLSDDNLKEMYDQHKIYLKNYDPRQMLMPQELEGE